MFMLFKKITIPKYLPIFGLFLYLFLLLYISLIITSFLIRKTCQARHHMHTQLDNNDIFIPWILCLSCKLVTWNVIKNTWLVTFSCIYFVWSFYIVQKLNKQYLYFSYIKKDKISIFCWKKFHICQHPHHIAILWTTKYDAYYI